MPEISLRHDLKLFLFASNPTIDIEPEFWEELRRFGFEHGSFLGRLYFSMQQIREFESIVFILKRTINNEEKGVVACVRTVV